MQPFFLFPVYSGPAICVQKDDQLHMHYKMDISKIHLANIKLICIFRTSNGVGKSRNMDAHEKNRAKIQS